MINRRRVAWMVTRNVLLLGSVVVLIALMANSPDHSAFWIIIGACGVALIPLAGAMGWFYGELRKPLDGRDNC